MTFAFQLLSKHFLFDIVKHDIAQSTRLTPSHVFGVSENVCISKYASVGDICSKQ